MITYDLRHALKGVVRRPGLSIAVLMILALGIGSTTTIFSIASSVLLSEIPYEHGDRLVVVKMLIEKEGSDFPASYLDVDSWQEQSRTLELISASSNGQQLNLTGGDRAERVDVSFVSTSYFDLLGSQPVLGRSFRPEEENPESPLAVAVLSHGFWQRRFGGTPELVGQSIQVHGLTFQVLGILPEDFRDVYPDIDLYVPVTMARLTHRDGYIQDRAVRWLEVFARRRPGVTIEQAHQEMSSIAQQLAATFPASNQGYAVRVEPLRTYQFDFENMRLSILTLLIGAVFVLLIGCANVTNLLLIRAVERRKELALRLALGITRFRLVRHFVLEGAILCLAGAVLGVGWAFSAVRLLAKFGNSAYNLPAFIDFSVDLRSLGAAVALSILISLLIGIVPARKSLKVDLQEELQSEGKGHSPSAGTALTRNFLVVSAIFFSVVLLIGAGLMIKSLTALIQSDPGFRVDDVLSARFELPASQYQTDGPAYLLYKQVIEKARTLPDVENAGLWAPSMLGTSFFLRFIVAEGRSLEAPEDKIKVYEHRVSPNLLQEMGITLLKGRDFTEHDDAKHPLVAILSRSAAEAIWPSQDPLGKRFWTGPPHDVWAEVVGVVADVDQRGRLLPDHEFRRDVYFPLFQMRSRTTSILLHTRQENSQAGVQLNEMMQAIAPDIPVYDIRTLQERRRDEEAAVRLNTFLLIFFASSALVLAVIGIYSILAYIVRQQGFEIGIRMAIGADRSDILRHFIWKGTALLAIGLLAGLAFAFILANTMSSMLFNVSPYDPLVFIAVPCIIALFSLPAILRPAAKATRADPSSLFRLN
ncbi:MAG TPA: ABC transporter permease [Thermoanaerobaculia bacterium]|nr:ABC transporter permease [Thermoanaerobaculia bacterium]